MPRATPYVQGSEVIPFPIADFGLQIAAHGVTMSDDGNDNTELCQLDLVLDPPKVAQGQAQALFELSGSVGRQRRDG